MIVVKFYKTSDATLIKAVNQFIAKKERLLGCASLYATLVSKYIAPCKALIKHDIEFYGLEFESLDNPCFTKPCRNGSQWLRSKIAKKYKAEYENFKEILKDCKDRAFIPDVDFDRIDTSDLVTATTIYATNTLIHAGGFAFPTVYESIRFKVINDNLMIFQAYDAVKVNENFVEITATEYDTIKNGGQNENN